MRFSIALTLFLLLFASSSLLAQSLEFTKKPTGPVSFDLDADVAKINLHVKNISSTPVKVWVTMDTSKCNAKHRAYFCWEQCYSFGVVDPRNIAGGKPITLAAGKDTSAFTAYIDHYAITNNPEPGQSTLDFAFFNEDDPSDRLEISLTFNVGNSTSIHDNIQTLDNYVSYNAFTEKLIFHGQDFTSVFLHSLNGESFQVQEGMSISHLASGIYGYSITKLDGTVHTGLLSIIR